jgi:hypothetical protein
MARRSSANDHRNEKETVKGFFHPPDTYALVVIDASLDVLLLLLSFKNVSRKVISQVSKRSCTRKRDVRRTEEPQDLPKVRRDKRVQEEESRASMVHLDLLLCIRHERTRTVFAS